LLVLLSISHGVALCFPQKSHISVWAHTANDLIFLVPVFNATLGHVAGCNQFGDSLQRYAAPVTALCRQCKRIIRAEDVLSKSKLLETPFFMRIVAD
jgi:hypothetical protein